MIKRYFLLIVLFCGVGMQISYAQESHNFKTTKALDIFNALCEELDLSYVDTLDAEQITEDAILYMLHRLDPYTEYYKASRTNELKTLTTGKYAGIGSPIRFHKSSDRCVFDGPFLGMPARLAGLRTGDIIMKINDKDVGVRGKQSASDYSTNITTLLRGDAGTKLTITIKRPGREKMLRFQLVRQIIKKQSVPYAQLLPNHVGYVVLTGYQEDTSLELRKAVEQLKAKGAQRLVLDLRDNGGGLMEEAVKVVNLFIPRGRKVLEVRGKDPMQNSVLKTTQAPLDDNMPMVVLVNGGTASAAEITSGTFQDYDRAIIVGERTYGKGLVQSQRPLPYDAMLKLTTAKYYIPSGRCVQAYDFKNRGEDGQPRHLPDSLCKTFKTSNGRVVKDGGGITPDVTVPFDSIPDLLGDLALSEEFFDYIVKYLNTHREWEAPASFRISDADFQEFLNHMGKSSYNYQTQTKRVFERLKEISDSEGYSDNIRSELAALEAKLKPNLVDDLKRNEVELRKLIAYILVSYHYGDEGLYAYKINEDKAVKESIDILLDKEHYHKLLHK
ncbi:MAG: S41 family peptidase [Alloprevotella sp.]|nr:MAG: S41 family peptidase [Alloprevotella sp.]